MLPLRLADSAKMGLVETRLAIIPGAGECRKFRNCRNGRTHSLLYLHVIPLKVPSVSLPIYRG